VVAPVLRAQNVVIGALDLEGNPFKVEASELLSVCIQHEMDHLEGKVFVDYLSRLKQDRIRKRLLKEDRGNSENDRHKKAVVY
jgi:peptide deformylase